MFVFHIFILPFFASGVKEFLEIPNSESPEVTQLKDYANVHGLSPDNVDLLLEYGYDVDDIVEMINNPEMLDNALLEILGLYYGETLR